MAHCAADYWFCFRPACVIAPESRLVIPVVKAINFMLAREHNQTFHARRSGAKDPATYANSFHIQNINYACTNRSSWEDRSDFLGF